MALAMITGSAARADVTHSNGLVIRSVFPADGQPKSYFVERSKTYDNPGKAAGWTDAANKIYSPALNGVFADALMMLAGCNGGNVFHPNLATRRARVFD